MKKAATVIAFAVAVTALMGATGKGCSGSAPNGGDHITVPAKAPGRCMTNLTVSQELDRIVGAMGFICEGAAVLTVNVSSLTREPDGSFDPKATLRAVNSALETSPVVVSTP